MVGGVSIGSGGLLCVDLGCDPLLGWRDQVSVCMLHIDLCSS